MQVVEEDRIRQLAAELAGRADQVRSHAHRLRAAAAGLDWHSPAAEAFVATVTGVLGQADRLGAELAATGSALGAHGNRAAQRAAMLAAAGSEVSHAAARAAEFERHAVTAALGRLGF